MAHTILSYMEHVRELSRAAVILVGQRNLATGRALLGYMAGYPMRLRAQIWANSLDAAVSLEKKVIAPGAIGPGWYVKSLVRFGGLDSVLPWVSDAPLSGPALAARIVSTARTWESEIYDFWKVVVYLLISGYLLVSLWGLLPDRTQPQRSNLAGMLAFTAEPAWEMGISRLRRRSRFVNRLSDDMRLEKGLVGKLLRGRWTPDLPTPQWPAENRFLAALISDGVKVLGGGLCGKSPIPAGLDPSDPRMEAVTFVRLDYQGKEILVIPKLVGLLSTRAVFTRRDAHLVASLRSKAIEWCKLRALDNSCTSLALPASVALACVKHQPEKDGEEVLEVSAALPHRLLGLLWPRYLSEWWLDGGK